MQGAIPPSMHVQHDFAKQIKKALIHYGIDKEPLGIDMMELPMIRALEKEGIEVVDGQQAMLDAREIKTADEIELLKVAAAMVDATYVDIARAIHMLATNGFITGVVLDANGGTSLATGR